MDQHALHPAGPAAAARGRTGRHLRAAQRGPRLMEGQYERVSQQSRELLYSVPAALCDEIARAAMGACGAAEHSGLGRSSKPRGLEQSFFSVILLVSLAQSLNAEKG